MPKSTSITEEINPIDNPRGWFKQELKKFFLQEAVDRYADLARVSDIIRNKKSANGLYVHYHNEAIQYMEDQLLGRYDFYTNGSELHPSFKDYAQMQLLVKEVFDSVLEEKQTELRAKETSVHTWGKDTNRR